MSRSPILAVILATTLAGCVPCTYLCDLHLHNTSDQALVVDFQTSGPRSWEATTVALPPGGEFRWSNGVLCRHAPTAAIMFVHEGGCTPPPALSLRFAENDPQSYDLVVDNGFIAARPRPDPTRRTPVPAAEPRS